MEATGILGNIWNLYRDYREHWGSIGIMEKKMAATI